MAAPYSEDLRGKVVQACERGTRSQREVAELFNVSLSFVEYYCVNTGVAAANWFLGDASVADTRCWIMAAGNKSANGYRNSRT